MTLSLRPGYRILESGAIRFTMATSADQPRLLGDFTDWESGALSLAPSGTNEWSVEIPRLPQGIYRYLYELNGNLQTDPEHPLTLHAPERQANCSVLAVGGPRPGEPDDLRILSLNLHTWQEEDAHNKLKQIAYVVAALDIDALGLQEVGEHQKDPDYPNAAELLRQHLESWTGEEWHGCWRNAHTGFHVFHEGIAILSRSPLEDVQEYRLSEGRWARNALFATLNLREQTFRLGTTHITWPEGGGHEEMTSLLQSLELEDNKKDLILCGDFNALATEAHMMDLVGHGLEDVAASTGTAFSTWPIETVTASASPKQNLLPPESSVIPPLSCRIDYQFHRPALPGGDLWPMGCLPLFHHGAIDNVYQPVVSDHIGVLGVYRLSH